MAKKKGKKSVYESRRAKRPKSVTAEARLVLKYFLWVVALVFAVAAAARWEREERSAYGAPDAGTVDCLMKVEMPDDVPEIIADYTGFRVSFNPSHHQPNYVVWELTGEEVEGKEPRSSKFMADPDVFGCATTDDYRRSGFDRGHMAPAGDMKWSAQAMKDSHYLTNICPQNHDLNGGRWSSLEKKCREWARRDSAIIIIAGPILSDELTRSIGASQVSVPERFFKVVMAPFVDPPRAIGFIMPNSRTDDGLEALAVTVDEVEAATGFDFFSCLPDDIENRIESNGSFRLWERRSSKKF